MQMVTVTEKVMFHDFITLVPVCNNHPIIIVATCMYCRQIWQIAKLLSFIQRTLLDVAYFTYFICHLYSSELCFVIGIFLDRFCSKQSTYTVVGVLN